MRIGQIILVIEAQHRDGSRRVSLLWETQTCLMTEWCGWMYYNNKMAGPSLHRGYSKVWAKARKNCELEWIWVEESILHPGICVTLHTAPRVYQNSPLGATYLPSSSWRGCFFFCLWMRWCPEPFPVTQCPIRSGHATEGWWCVNLAVPKHTQSCCQNGIILKGFLQQKRGGGCFFDPRNLSLWTRQVMTNDKRQVQPINAEWRSVQGTLTGSGWVDHVQFGLNLQLSTGLRGTLFKEENI